MPLEFGTGGWTKKKAVIVVRTYPAPARNGVEVSCTAAIGDGAWLRLFPIPWRLLPEKKKFHKYEWIEAEIRKASTDTRPESYNVNLDSLTVLPDTVPVDDHWKARRALLDPLRRASMCEIDREWQAKKAPTLGFFRPKRIRRLVIEEDPDGPDWTAEQRAKLRQVMGQGTLWKDEAHAPKEELEKIPYKFIYEFECDDGGCCGHGMSCTDWEIAQLYRNCRRDHGDKWVEKFRQRAETEMIEKYDTHFYVGTLHAHPGTWIIVGLFYPLPASSSEPETLTLGL
ncbi:MAG TPA: hypothetical protein VFC31_00340 [Candidatus Limnocylindria bacterium]|nr:hypothetical protein [Candidatus Limnocylindria bacterium]